MAKRILLPGLEKLGSTPARKSGGRRPLPAHLERIEEIIEPEERAWSCGACARVKIGEDVSERLDVVAPKFQVIVTRRPRYACQACRESIVQAPAPARLIEGGIATERSFLQKDVFSPRPHRHSDRSTDSSAGEKSPGA